MKKEKNTTTTTLSDNDIQYKKKKNKKKDKVTYYYILVTTTTTTTTTTSSYKIKGPYNSLNDNNYFCKHEVFSTNDPNISKKKFGDNSKFDRNVLESNDHWSDKISRYFTHIQHQFKKNCKGKIKHLFQVKSHFEFVKDIINLWKKNRNKTKDTYYVVLVSRSSSHKFSINGPYKEPHPKVKLDDAIIYMSEP